METEIRPEDRSLAEEINKKSFTPLIIAVIVVIVVAVIGLVLYSRSKKTEKPIACTQDSMICPDGSSVGRTGPNCEFAECPKVLSELDKELQNLNIDKSKLKQDLKVILPKTFTDANWSLKEKSCRQGGYDIKPYAGKEVLMKLFGTNESFKGESLDIWVIINGDKVICAYKVAKEGSNSAPGIFPIISK